MSTDMKIIGVHDKKYDTDGDSLAGAKRDGLDVHRAILEELNMTEASFVEALTLGAKAQGILS